MTKHLADWEIIQLLVHSGPSTVAGLAAATGRHRAGLEKRLQFLVRTKRVTTRVEVRPGPGRNPVVYEAVNDPFRGL